ncbi:insulinase family protein [bacterium]|nr:insulinase family protein [bacterium]
MGVSRRPVTCITLPNGLTVAVVTDMSASIASVKAYVKAGSMTEGVHLGKGLSHFLEHLVAGGATTRRTEDEYKACIQQMGGAYNAYTTIDHTCYHLTVLPHDTRLAIDILSEWMGHHAFQEAVFDRERDVITREIEKGQAELGRVFYHLCQTHFYPTHPCRYPVIGFRDSFLSVTLADLQAYYHRMYTASNMVVVVGGPLGADEVIQWVASTFGAMPAVAPPFTPIWAECPPVVSRQLTSEWACQHAYLNLRFATVPLHHPDVWALDLLDDMLTNGYESLLYRDVVENRQLAYDLDSGSLTPHYVRGYLDIGLELPPESIDDATACILDHLSRLRDTVTPERLARAKKQKQVEEAFSVTTIDDEVARVGSGLLIAGTPYFAHDYAAHYESVTTDAVWSVAERYLQSDRLVRTAMVPSGRSKASVSLPADATGSPSVETLSNGMTLVSLIDPMATRAVIKLYLDAGVCSETRATNGVGALVADLMGQRCRGFDKGELTTWFESRGAVFEVVQGNHSLGMTLCALPEDMPSVWPVALTAFFEPVFHPDDVVLSQRQLLKSIQSRPDDWYRHAMYQFRQHFFGDHPYGMSLLGDTATVSSLTATDCADWFDGLLGSSSVVVAVSGAVSLPLIREALLECAIPTVRSRSLPILPVASPPSEGIQGGIAHDVAAVMVVYEGASLQSIEEVANLDALLAILTGYHYPGGVLHDALRDEGLVYMVHGTQFAGRHRPGYLMICALTSEPQLDRVVEVIFHHVNTLLTTKVSQTQLDEAKAQMRFVVRERRADPSAFVGEVALDALLGLGSDRAQRVDAVVDQLTPDTILATARRWLATPLCYRFRRLNPD